MLSGISAAVACLAAFVTYKTPAESQYIAIAGIGLTWHFLVAPFCSYVLHIVGRAPMGLQLSAGVGAAVGAGLPKLYKPS